MAALCVAVAAAGAARGAERILFVHTVYVSEPEGEVHFYDGRIQAASPAGTAQRPLPCSLPFPAAKCPDAQPAASPRGTRVAFVDGKPGIVIADRSGRVVRRVRLPLSPDSPAWSPDGSHLVFHAYRDGAQLGTYTVRTDGTHLRHISWIGESPTWSSRGQIAFADRDANLYVTDTAWAAPHASARIGQRTGLVA